MRNLKRALSLTLASVMLLGMMVIGTSAASFTDADQITNETAATVLQELEVMQGSNGKFNPNSTVTRGQMAILICKMLYGNKLNADNFAGTSEFTDVPANAYYTGYVNLASQLGIISGYGNGKFGPGAPVTTAQAALMLTRALGWFQAGELENQNWTSNAIAAVEKATSVNLFGSMKLANNEPLSRDNVCEMVFNAMTKTAPVKYNERWGAYYTDEGQIMGGVKFDYKDSLGYKNFTLVYNTTKSDDFGRPATEWGIGNGRNIVTDDHGDIVSATIRKSILKAADEATASYTSAVKSEVLYKDLGLDKTATASVVIDGKDAPDFTIAKSNSTKIGANGALVDAYKDKDNKVTITVINTYMGEISKVTPAKGNDERTVTVNGKKFETEGFAVDDVVVYTMADGAIKTMNLANVVSDVEITKTVGTSEFVAGGNTYKFTAKFDKVGTDPVDLVADKSDVSKENKVDLYLDNSGYVVKVKLNEGVTDYAYVLATDEDAGKLFKEGVPYAKLLLTDGTVVEAELKYGDYDDVTDETSLGTKFDHKIVEYSKNTKGVYKLKTLTGSYVLAENKDVTIDAGKAKMTLEDAKNSGVIYADSKTIFLVDEGDDKYSTYTGYNSVPSLSNTTGDADYAYFCKDDGTVATVIYVSNVSASTDDIVFLLAAECGKETEVKDGDNYFECPAVVNGEIVKVKLDESVKGKTKVLLKSIVYANEKEEIIDYSASKAYSTTTTDDNYYLHGDVDKKLTNGNLTIDGVSVRVDENAKVFVYSDKIEDSSIGSIAAGDTGYFVVNDGKIVTAFYKEAEDEGGVTEIDVADVTPLSSNWKPVGTEITVSGFEVKSGVELTLDMAVEAVAQKVLKENPTWVRDAGNDTSDATYYNVAFKSGGATRTAKITLSDVSAPDEVVTATTAKEVTDALSGDADAIVINDSVTLPANTALSKEIRVASGATVSVSGTTAITAEINGEGTVKIQGAVTGANNIKTEGGIDLTASSSVDGNIGAIPVKVSGDAEIKAQIDADATVEVTEGKTLTLTASTTLPKFENSSKGTVKIKADITAASGSQAEQFDALTTALGGDKVVVDGSKASTDNVVERKSVKLSKADGTGKLLGFSSKTIQATIVDEGATTASLMKITIENLPTANGGVKVVAKKFLGASDNTGTNMFAETTVNDGELEATLMTSDKVTKIVFTVTPKTGADTWGEPYTITYTVK